MALNTNSPILVTGIHRSGSTFVGNILSLNKNVGYIQEPFNQFYGLSIFDTDFKYLKAGTVSEDIQEVLDNLINLKKATYSITSVTESNKVIQGRRGIVKEAIQNISVENIHKYIGKILFRSDSQLKFQRLKYNPRVNRVLMKDPLASLSSQYLSRRYDMDVVVLVRHPLSFAGSLKRLGWRFNFDNFLGQKQLMNDYLEEYREELIHLKNKETTVTEEAAMLWNCIYSVLTDFIKKNPSFIVYTHEQIARQPLESFEDLYKKLDLNFTLDVEEEIKSLTSSDNPTEANNNRAHQFNRNSAALIYKWKEILTAEEAAYISEKTAPLTSAFYDQDFFLNK